MVADHCVGGDDFAGVSDIIILAIIIFCWLYVLRPTTEVDRIEPITLNNANGGRRAGIAACVCGWG